MISAHRVLLGKKSIMIGDGGSKFPKQLSPVWDSGSFSDTYRAKPDYPDEKLLVKRCLGFFAGSESLVANNLLLTVNRFVTDPECRQYILRQAYEESLHNWTVVTCCDSFSLKVKDVYEAYLNVPSIKAKDDFLMQITTDVNRQGFSTKRIYPCLESTRSMAI